MEKIIRMMPPMEYIKIEEPKILNGRTLLFKLCYSRGVEKYFTLDYLICEYDRKIGNVNGGILQIPAIASIITFAWAIGTNIYIKRLDATYLESLNKVKSVMKYHYPKFSFSTKIIVENVVSNRFSNNGNGLLFGGGIDSTASYIRHRNEKPNLITVWGAGIDIHPCDEKAKKRLIDFSDKEEVKVNFIKTNVDEVIDKRLLDEKFGLDWWINVNHGMALAGLSAPLTSVENIGTLWMASSVTREYRYLHGSHPLIINNISWANVNVVHDGYEMSRHEKIRYIIKNYVKQGHDPFLKVCTKQSGGNCVKCEKCLRTITALVLEDIDPSKCGFNNIERKTFDFVMESLIKGNLVKRKGIIERKTKYILATFCWKDIQKHIPETINVNKLYNSKNFFEWFKDFDVERTLSGNIKISRLPQLLLYSELKFFYYRLFYCHLPKNARNIIENRFNFFSKIIP